MHYSLLNRFRGTLLGGAWGESLGRCWSQQPRPTEAPLSLSQIGQSFGKVENWISEHSYFGITGPVQHSTHSLIQRGEAGLTWSQSKQGESASWLAHEAALQIVPLALFLHDDLLQLQRQWQQAVEPCHPPLLALSDGATAIAYAISQAIKGQLHPPSLIPQTILYLQTHPAPAPGQQGLVQQLALVQSLLEDRAALATALIHLRTSDPFYTPLAIAFYCFLSSPDDLHLSTVRAARSGQWPVLTCSLVGILAGAYGGCDSIPGGWRFPTPSPSPDATASPSLKTHLLSLADQLWAAWGGLYDPSNLTPAVTDQVAIAAPRILRLR
jgi:ADP-ribosylglycohydrolase